MYGKIFDSIYDGTLYGHWEAIVTMQQLIVLATPEGLVDMTPQAIAARTSIPINIIDKGLAFLAEPDPYTRTPGDDGRRIVLLDDHRPWGWRLVNHAKYRGLRDLEQKREADRARIAEKRKQNSDVATPSQDVANVAHSDSDSDSDTDSKEKERSKAIAPSASPSKPSSRGNGSHEPEDQGEVIERIPLCDGTEFEVRKSFVDELDRLFPAVDPVQTLHEIRAWNLAKKARRKTRRGVKAHITTWFGREQDKHSARAA